MGHTEKFKPAKAGVLLWEAMPNGERKLMMVCNEGRFAKNGQQLVLPKGSLDPGETPLRGGLRECEEETGIPLSRILGEANIAKLERGQHLHHIRHQDFPGFEIVTAHPRQHRHTYHARSSKQQTLVMYGMRVQGLDSLANYPEKIGHKNMREILKENPQLPQFQEFLSWLKQGCIPACGNIPETPLGDAGRFSMQLAQHAPGGMNGRRDWQKFCAALPGPEYHALRESFGTIKEHLKARKLLEGDDAELKFDEKDCPLFWYTERRFIGEEKPILTKIFTDVRDNSDYALAFGGTGSRRPDLTQNDAIWLGQVAALRPFVSGEAWDEALNETWPVKRQSDIHMEPHRRRVVMPSPPAATAQTR